jgi:hypothetical protein
VKPPRCLPTIVCVRDVLTVLRDTTHHGFPVVQQMGTPEEGVGQLQGLVLRSQLLVLLREQYARALPAASVSSFARSCPMNARC